MSEVHDTRTDPAGPAMTDTGGGVLRCPSCGYDLRGTTSDRCSECGLVIDREAIRVSAVPWAHRGKIGRFRAFVKTIWQITFDYKRLRNELDKPQSLSDARRFRRVIAVLLALTLCAAFWVYVDLEGLGGLAVSRDDVAEFTEIRSKDGTRQPSPGWMEDLALPWSFGVRLFPLTLLGVAGFAIYWTGVTPRAMRKKNVSPEHFRRQEAMGLYASAPLIGVPLAAVCFIVAVVVKLSIPSEFRGLINPIMTALYLAAAIVLVLGLLFYFRRSGEWVTRADDASVSRFFTGLLEILVRWAGGAVMFLGVWPWCAGLWWMMLDRP